MRKKQFYATCVGYRNVEELERIIERSKPISRRRFLIKYDVPKKLIKEMRRFPHDYEFFKSQSRKKEVYYFTWSMIEHLYK